MISKTPKFDEKIKLVLENSKPGFRHCAETGEEFEIRGEDLKIYEDLKVPPPIFAPWVRQRRRYITFGTDELFRRKSALSGKDIITTYDPESLAVIYANDEWWGDNWDPLTFGLHYNSEESFFEQLHKLQLKTPRPAEIQDPASVNSEWAIRGIQLKNCYMTWGGAFGENVMYAMSFIKTRDSMELLFADECELCYELFECKKCFKSAFLDNSESCIECVFGFDLRNCENCFGCTNLRYKKYCFFNEQLTKEAYEEKMSVINLGSRKELHYWQRKFEEFRKKSYQVNLRMKSVENSFGDDLVECKDCYFSFSVYNSENVSYVFRSLKSRQIIDVDGALNVERSVEVAGVVNSYEIKFSDDIRESRSLEYCDLCFNCENCFGCVGLRNKKFCILNRQYSESDYWVLVDQIKSKMLDDGEYGIMPPLKYSLYAYNAAAVNYVYPLTHKEADAFGVRWYEAPKISSAKSNAIPANELPDKIKNVQDEIIGKSIICAETSRLFTIVKPELEFYRKMNLPLPLVHPKVRAERRFKKVRAPKFRQGWCDKCKKEISIRGKEGEQAGGKIVCNDCYLTLTH